MILYLCKASRRRINNPFSGDVKYGARLMNKLGTNVFLLSERWMVKEMFKWKLKSDSQIF
jgi:hypothetical protein